MAFTLIAGRAFGRASPVPVHSDLFLVEVKSDTPTHLDLSGQLNGELGILLVDGSLSTDGETLEAGSILFSKVRERCHLRLEADTNLMLFGGEPFPEERHIHWNFVSSDPGRIKAARESWRNRDFPMMEGEDSYIPLPGSE